MLRCAVYVQNLLGRSLCRDDRGATAVEYGLMVALIAAVIVRRQSRLLPMQRALWLGGLSPR